MMNMKIKQSVVRMAIAACVLAGSMALSAGLTYADSGRGGGGDEQRQENRQEDRQEDRGNGNSNRGSNDSSRGSDDSSSSQATPAAPVVDDSGNHSNDDQQPRQEDRREDRREDRQTPGAPITSTLPLTSPLPLPRNDDNPGRGRGHDDSPSQPVTVTLPITAPVEVRGILLSAPASITSTITVNGVSYTLTTATRIRQPQGALTAGACVQVKYVVQNGVNVAVAVKTVNRNAANCTGS